MKWAFLDWCHEELKQGRAPTTQWPLKKDVTFLKVKLHHYANQAKISSSSIQSQFCQSSVWLHCTRENLLHTSTDGEYPGRILTAPHQLSLICTRYANSRSWQEQLQTWGPLNSTSVLSHFKKQHDNINIGARVERRCTVRLQACWLASHPCLYVAQPSSRGRFPLGPS